MSEPFVGQIQQMSFSFAPKNYALCNGQLLAISENQSLYALLGTQFGGDGRTSMGIPDLRGRVPMGAGHSYYQGLFGGAETVTLTTATLPQHTHDFMATSDPGNTNIISSNKDTVLATSDGSIQYYTSASSLTAMNSSTSGSTGGGNAHTNVQPFLSINFIIALTGIFPSRN